MDTLFWLLNFPVSHGYAMVFIAGFSLMGLGALAVRPVGRGSTRLGRVRESEGLPDASAGATGRVILGHVQRALFRVLAIVMLAGLVLGILGLTRVPVTNAYIHANGVPTTATLDGEWVTFSTPSGETYTLESNFFTPAQYPDPDAFFSGDQVVVRYLAGHPQAFVIDSEQSAG